MEARKLGFGLQRQSTRVMQNKRKELVLMCLIGISLVSGIVTGLMLNLMGLQTSKRQYHYIKFPGEIFLRMLKMFIFPLIISSNFASVASLSVPTVSWLSLTAGLLVLSLGLISGIMGTAIPLIVRIPACLQQPGNNTANHTTSPEIQDAMLDLVRNFFPDNVIRATMQLVKTKFGARNNQNICQFTHAALPQLINSTTTSADGQFVMQECYVDAINIPGLLSFSIIFGLALHTLGMRRLPLVELANLIRLATVQALAVLIWFSPIGIASLIIAELSHGESLSAKFQCLGLYIVWNIAGTVLLVVSLTVLYALIVKENPFRLISQCMPPILCACGSSSSTVTLPYLLYTMENLAEIDRRVIRFLVPGGTALNKLGTTFWMAVSATYLAQLRGVSLTASQMMMNAVAAQMYSIATSSIPSGGIIMLTMMITSSGFADSDFLVAYLLPWEWLVDRLRTVSNVYGNIICTAIVSKLSHKRLKSQKMMIEQRRENIMLMRNRNHTATTNDGTSYREQSEGENHVERRKLTIQEPADPKDHHYVFNEDIDDLRGIDQITAEANDMDNGNVEHEVQDITTVV